MRLFNLVLVCLLALTASAAFAQRRVDPRNTYHRILVVVPYVGSGTATDPIRPKYAPWPPRPAGTVPSRTDIIGYMQVASDDKKFALVEFVAQDMAAFAAILNDGQLKVFEKGKNTKNDIEGELKKFKKDFSLDSFGVVMP